ncbi:MAG: UvrD-helicase domain-containing protein [Bryobacteraceae bacterium]|nr:UvrD-helicase domain-containing protein [Bryobacteraceae bacterium]MDW8380010.1 UvrD-helicase domain-containing protein [Bryobacterales bacterium]
MTPGLQSADEAARLRIRESLTESLLVEASAGTGKTTELVQRLVNLLQRGVARIERIVAVTFTNKAAGELKLRLRHELDRRRGEASDLEEIANLEQAISHLEEATIGTIHSFCGQLLRERPVEAGVDPSFEELDDSAARRVFSSVFRRWLQEKLNQESPGLRRALAHLAGRQARDFDYTPVESLEFAAWRLAEWRDFPAPWRRPTLERQKVIDELIESVQQIATQSDRYPQDVVEPFRELALWTEQSPRDYDMLESLLVKLHRAWKKDRKRAPDLRWFEALDQFQQVVEVDLAAQVRAELWEVVLRYEQQKQRAGQLDFLDLLLLTRNLLRDNQEVRNYFQQRFSCLLVDEFQDVDPLQAEILLLLCCEDPEVSDWKAVKPAPGKLFLVGDPKQSIYKFRRADVQLYQKLRELLSGRGVATVQLRRSFRSVASIQECVNAAFAHEFKADLTSAQVSYVPLEKSREDLPGQPAVIALPAPRPYGRNERLAKSAIQACLPETVAGFIDWLLHKSNWRVGERGGEELVPVRPQHICILFRRFTNFQVDVTRGYLQALEARNIPHLLVGSKMFHEREEIEALRAVLTAIEWPEDELSVFAALHGPFFAIPDVTLLRFRLQYGRIRPLAELPENVEPEFQPVREVLSLLAELHCERNRRPFAETVHRLMEATRCWAGFALWPAGYQVLANVRRVIDLARQFESRRTVSFRAFVEELEAQAERADSAEAPVVEEGSEGVRLMTVHAAKGLEFPVVILADMTANLAAQNPERHVDSELGLCAMRLLQWSPQELKEAAQLEQARDQAEGIRVAYVAATRARDLLVAPVIGDGELDGWLRPLNPALYPPDHRKRQAEKAPHCPEFGPVSVVDRPPCYPEETSVRPGLHVPRNGQHRVVWWDPRILLDRPLKPARLSLEIAVAKASQGAEPGLGEYRAWVKTRQQALERGRRPSIEVLLASEAQQAPEGWQDRVVIQSAPPFSGRPSGKRFGALVHSVLREIRLGALRSEIEQAARLQARILGADRQETEAATLAVEAALRHPLIDRARAAEQVHREYPVFLPLEDGRVFEGVIDLAFLQDGTWNVVDFKTESNVALYVPQIAWYAYALSNITALPTKAYLLRV